MTHGTESGYVGGCRCDECKAASAEARQRRRNGEGPGKIPWTKHGIWGYSAHRCRCDICRAANTEQMRRYVARKRAREQQA